ncbi:fusion GTPase [Schizosaccharomyces octosporus yFS286]|uniref:Fusion GTPase n=1 Tax=Schizosaccharomyces octosporus (strain yFS286) TaxID=483514 RepID=S9RMP6_SCHOY|nr:fusion GTPase [Schizosaccharomyces octosporus yFS286]EPX75224.1 fusion GTPase [Schizosaccharomyces octosporus yFS286]
MPEKTSQSLRKQDSSSVREDDKLKDQEDVNNLSIQNYKDETNRQQFEYNQNKNVLLRSIHVLQDLLGELNEYVSKQGCIFHSVWGSERTKSAFSNQLFEFDIPKMNILTPDLALHAKSEADELIIGKLGSEAHESLLKVYFERVNKHLFSLYSRVEDTSSKVLITGDLNAGKSTLCNALVHRDILPEDQQPCTEVFCEVLDAEFNDKKDCVHAVPHGKMYSFTDSSTYVIFPIEDLKRLVYETENWSMLKVYIDDGRPAYESLLHNGITDIALIDAPGLNTDSMKTTSVFACQEEIDVVVFVVNAENHFTLSATEFLKNASTEKSHIFIIINKFDNIRDKERCKRLILDQIQNLSPETYADAKDLVHFVSCRVAADPNQKDNPIYPSFYQMENSLRTFILENRSKSKLAPVRKYLVGLLSDLTGICDYNLKCIDTDVSYLHNRISDLSPKFRTSKHQESQVYQKAEALVESTVQSITQHAHVQLETAIENLSAFSSLKYSGFLFAYNYGVSVRNAMQQYLEETLLESEEFARKRTSETVQYIQENMKQNFSDALIPVFRSHQMFVRRHQLQLQKHFRFELGMLDFIDLDLTERLGTWSASVSTILLVLGKTTPSFTVFTSLVEKFGLSFFNFFKTRTLQNLLIPVLGLTGIAVFGYVVYDIPRALPLKISEKIKNSLRETEFSHNTSLWIGTESRKVLNVPLNDLRNMFQHRWEEQKETIASTENELRICQKAHKFFIEMNNRLQQTQRKTLTVHLEGCEMSY